MYSFIFVLRAVLCLFFCFIFQTFLMYCYNDLINSQFFFLLPDPSIIGHFQPIQFFFVTPELFFHQDIFCKPFQICHVHYPFRNRCLHPFITSKAISIATGDSFIRRCKVFSPVTGISSTKKVIPGSMVANTHV